MHVIALGNMVKVQLITILITTNLFAADNKKTEASCRVPVDNSHELPGQFSRCSGPVVVY